MATFKVTFRFNAPRGGWTENFITTQADITTCKTVVEFALPFRLGCSPPDVLFIDYRITTLPVAGPILPTPRTSQLFNVGLGGSMIAPGISNLPDTLALKVQLKGTAATLQTRVVDVGGLMDSQTNFNAATGQGLMGPILGAAIDLYKASLVAMPIQIYSKVPPTATGFGWDNVVSVVGFGNAGGQLTFNTAGAPLVNQGDYVAFGRVKGKLFPGIVGNWPVLTATGSSFTIGYYNNYSTTPFTAVGNLRYRKVNTQYNTLSNLIYRNLRPHKYGRPFGDAAGRRKAVSFRR